MALCRRDVADAAVMVLVVVPVHEAGGPLPGGIEVSKALERERGAILSGAEQGFAERIVVADARAGVGGPSQTSTVVALSVVDRLLRRDLGAYRWPDPLELG